MLGYYGLAKRNFFNKNTVTDLWLGGLKRSIRIPSYAVPRMIQTRSERVQLKPTFLLAAMRKPDSIFMRRVSLLWRTVGLGRNSWNDYNRYYNRNRFSRLKGPAIFTVLFCIGTTIFAPYVFQYTPMAYFKRAPSSFVHLLIAANGIVFLMWRMPQFSKILTTYGLLMKDAMYSKWSMLGSAFSHQSFAHILVNMFVLLSFGPPLCSVVGVSNFAVMYLNSAVISSFTALFFPVLMRRSLATVSLGASGAVFSVLGAFSYLFPKAAVGFFFIPIPGGSWIVFLGTLLYNFAGFSFRWGSYDFASHIGGSLTGIAYGWWFQKKKEERFRNNRITVY